DSKIPALLEDRRSVDVADEEAISRAILIRHGLMSSGKPDIGETPDPRRDSEVVWQLPAELEELRQLRRRLILHAGSAVSAAAGLPSLRELAQGMAAKLPDHVPESRRALVRELCSHGALPDAFTELERELGEQKFGKNV